MLQKPHTRQIDKPQLERLWTQKAAKDTLSPQDYMLWQELGSTHRLYVGIGRTLLVWQADNGVPSPVCGVHIESANASFGQGFKLSLRRHDNWVAQISHTPTKLPGLPLFAWVPCFSEVRWAPIDYDQPEGQRYLTVPLCIKMQSNPAKGLVEGDIYVSSVMQFRQDWPQLKNLQF